jgi:hypothetical protein
MRIESGTHVIVNTAGGLKLEAPAVLNNLRGTAVWSSWCKCREQDMRF